MESLVTAILTSGWPWLILVIGAAVGLYYVSKALPTLRDTLLIPFAGWLKKISRRERDRIDSELADLRRQVDYLTKVVDELRARDHLNWAWIVNDQEWHRRVELEAIDQGWSLPRHVSYDEFREEWAKSHPMPTPYRV